MTMLFMGLTVLVPLFLGIPIAVTLGGAGLIWLLLKDPNLVQGIGFSLWNTSSSDVLTSIPLFILMGELIQRSDVARRFYDSISLWLRGMPGGLIHANVVASAIFAAVSGSSTATAATIGTAAVPNLKRLGYDKSLTLGTLAAGGTLGILIPPSVPLIIYASMVEASVGKLFIAAFLPGVLMALIFSLYVAVVAKIRPQVAPEIESQTLTPQAVWKSLIGMLPLFSIILLILGGIYLGWTTATEAAAVGTAAAMAVALLQRKLTVAILVDSIISVVRFTAMLMFVILGAQIFSFAVFSWNFGVDIANHIASLPYSPVVILMIITLMYVIIGMFVDPISIMVMTLPIVYPVIVNLGYDPIWFGVFLVLLLEIGLITPPVGMNLFAIQGIDPDEIKLGAVARGAAPFVLLLLLGVALLIAMPQIALWLPSRMF